MTSDRGDKMIGACFQFIISITALLCIAFVIKAILNNPDTRCQYGNCDECPFPRCRKEMSKHGCIHNRRLPRRMAKTHSL